MGDASRADVSPRSGVRSPAVRDGLAVGLATAVYGISFGALAVAAGLDVWQTSFLSLIMFTGGSQFALVGVLAGGGVAAGGSAIATAALLGVRNVVYGMRMKPLVDTGGPWRRAAAAWITIDESTAVALAQLGTTSPARTGEDAPAGGDTRADADRLAEQQARIGFWVTGIAIFVGWNVTTLIGALIGDAIGDTNAWGLDAAAAAAFLGLLWPRLKTLQAGAVAVAAGLVAAFTTPVLMPGLPVLVAALVAVAVGWFDVLGCRREREATGPA